uniref:ATP synthase subunit a, chloroplastic n=1 Tax=Eustigmatophyceae sp. Chic 10/23 P-6w TaxID=1446905 RepID=A0A3R5U9B7_9STRA|nr:ATP synthase CF0 subunit IV [Eustigmatophyceae sp. Chic 10/23 P-6w]QAA11569.1 ATP synthase CF0 subunit IV [Eustigmatophyceae sp. Chic 10/23 P-6w]
MIISSSTLIQIADLEVGKHFYWEVFGYSLHGQVFLVSWLAIFLVVGASILGTSTITEVPRGLWQNVMEAVVEYVQNIAKSQIGKDFKEWVPFIGSLFLFIFVSNWLGAIVPWKLIHLPEGELAAPTNDINTTVSLALLTSATYFYGGIKKKGFSYFGKYLQPTPILLPINILEDFTKPLSLSFRLFGNVLADELTVSVLTLLVPILIPLPIMILGLFAGSIQALIFATLAAAYIGESVEGHH